MESLTESLPRAIPFDPNKRFANMAAAKAAQRLAADLFRREMVLGLRNRRRSPPDAVAFAKAVEAILCNLVVLHLCGATRPLAVPRSSAAMWGEERYREAVFGKHFLDALRVMQHPNVGLIEEVAKGYRYAGSAGRLTTIRPRQDIAALLAIPDPDWSMLRREEDREVIILKDAKMDGRAEAIAYEETPRTRAFRNRLRKINGWLAKAPIFLLPGYSQFDNADTLVDPTRRTLRRIFNNADWGQGGRLYGGFWETMRRTERSHHLRIGSAANPDGERIATVDYGQLFPRLAYARVGHAPPDGDLYGSFAGASRKGVKVLLNALLFTKGPLSTWPKDCRQHFPGRKFADVLAEIRAAYAPIVPLFGTGVGFALMFLESEILMEVLGDLRRMDVVALPVHDAVLVAVTHADTAKAVMGRRLLERLPEEFRASVTIGD